MATADVIEVRFEADTSKYLSDLRTADSQFAAITGRMEKEALDAGAAFSRLGAQASGAFNAVASQSGAAASGIQKANLQTGNLAAQINDIGVQLAGGQSPFLIAIQQGSQINQVLGQAGAGGAVRALGSAFASLVNPVSLATIAFITLGGVAIQYLGSILPKTETANEAIKRHKDAISSILEGYDDAKRGLDEYLATAGRLPQQAVQLELTEQLKVANAELDQFTSKAEQYGNVLSNSFDPVEAQLSDILLQFSKGEISAGELVTELTRLGNQDLGILRFALDGLIDDLTDGAKKASALEGALIAVTFAAAAAAGDADLQFKLDESVDGLDKALDAIKGMTPELRTQQQIIEDTYAAALPNALTEEAKVQLQAAKDTALAAVTETEARAAAADAARLQATAGKEAQTAADNEREAVIALIEALEFEASLIGLTNEQKAVEIALRKAGTAATEEQRAAIEALTLANLSADASLKQMQEAYDAIKASAENALTGFLNDLAEGKSAGEAFKNVLDDILGQLIQFGVSTALNAIFPGLGSLTGLAGGRASGGPVRAGGTYMVGENGPELFSPTSAGSITRNGDATASTGTGRVEIYLGAGLEASILDQSAQQSVEIVRSLTPSMIERGAPSSVAQSRRNRVA